ncbi:hypothetical protein FF2_036928 [Malus domestica]
MNSPFIRELGGENGGESSISANGSGGGYDEIRSDDGGDEQTSANASCGGDDEISSEDGNDEQSVDEKDVPKPPIASTRSAWGKVAQWIIGVSIPLIAGSTTVVCTRSKGITFNVFNFFTNKISFLMLLLTTIILRTPFPKLTPCLFIRILGLYVFSPGFLVLWCQILASPVYYLLAIDCPRIGIFYLINLQDTVDLYSQEERPTKTGGLIITFGGAFLIGKYNGPTIAAHQVLYENWTWPLCLVVASVLCSACHNENTIEKYDVEALWLATIVRFTTMIPSLVIALATTHGRAYKWVMGGDFNTLCWVFTMSFGISAGLVQYLGTTLTKKTDDVFVSSFTPISMILVIGLSTMIFHDRIKKPSIGGVIMIVIGLCIFHWGAYRSTSKEEARAEDERLRWRLNLQKRMNLMHVQKEERSI